jgi:glucosamine kinase
MLFVVEGGSTKADWMLADGKEIIARFHTIGFNPYFHDSEFIYQTLRSDQKLSAYADAEAEIRYFGAGCSSAEKNRIVQDGLNRFFRNATIHVDHDLMACAYATCGDTEGIACIIGTGSNSCYYDGKKVHEKNYGLGYILGDEGSGSYYGKKLVTNYLYGLMPEHLSSAFTDHYRLDKNSIIRHVYNEPNANVWLASFMPFISERRSDPWMHDLLMRGMHEFFDLYVCNYEHYKNLTVHFVGSLSFIFTDELKEAQMLKVSGLAESSSSRLKT